MNDKLSPIQLNCGRIYSTAFKGRVTPISPDGYGTLTSYIRTFSATAKALLETFCSMATVEGDDRLAIYLLLNPSVVPQAILDTQVWKDVVLSGDGGIAGRKWDDILKSSNAYIMLRGYVFPEARKTGGGTAYKLVLDHYGIKPPSITEEWFKTVFGAIDLGTILSTMSVQVAGAAKSFLSNKEGASALAREHAATVQGLMKEHGAFFNPFQRFFMTQAAQDSASRYFTVLRRELRDEKVPSKVISACQWRAVLLRPGITAWQPIDPKEPEFLASADEYPAILARFVALLPESDPTPFIPSDRFRRLSSAGSKPKDLARDRGVLSRILALHQAAFGLLPPEQLDLLEPGDTEEHAGWLRIIAADKKDIPLKAIKDFVTGPVRAFCAAMRPVSIPSVPDTSGLSPLLPNNRYGWELAEAAQVGAPSNCIYVSLYIPAHRPVEAPAQMSVPALVEARIRGNIPGNRATRLPQAIDVKNGATQFRPDATLPMPGDPEGRKLFFKAQALRLTIEDRDAKRVFGCFSATVMPEIAEASLESSKALYAQRAAAREAKQDLKPGRFRPVQNGELLAVVHASPGGLRVATLTMFRKVNVDREAPTGWEPYAFQRVVRETHKEALHPNQVSVNGNRRVLKNTIGREDMIVHFNADSLDQEFEGRGSRLSKGFIPMEVNRAQMKDFGVYRTNEGKRFYRKIARSIADICAANGVGHVVIGGGGPIFGKGSVRHPARDFYTLAQLGGRLTPQGYLPSALAKIGVSAYSISAKSATLLNGGWRDGSSESLPFGVPFHDETVAESDAVIHTAVTRGKKNKIVDLAKVASGENWLDASSCYASNAAWAILLSWYDAKFKDLAEKTLAGAGERTTVTFPVISVRKQCA